MYEITCFGNELCMYICNAYKSCEVEMVEIRGKNKEEDDREK